MNKTNMEDLNSYFEDQTYTPEEEMLLSTGFLEGKVYHGIVVERETIKTTNPDKFTNQQMPMVLYSINFKIENDREKVFKFTLIAYPKDHPYHHIMVDNKGRFKRATGVDIPNAFASDNAFIGKEVDATLKKNKKNSKFIDINFIDKGVVSKMEQAGQNVPDGKQESFDDDIPF